MYLYSLKLHEIITAVARAPLLPATGVADLCGSLLPAGLQHVIPSVLRSARMFTINNTLHTALSSFCARQVGCVGERTGARPSQRFALSLLLSRAASCSKCSLCRSDGSASSHTFLRSDRRRLSWRRCQRSLPLL